MQNKEKKLKRSKKKYDKLIHSYRNHLKKSIDKIYPFDYSFGLDLLVNFLRFMLEYYTIGYNVMQSDESKQATIKTLSEALREYKLYEDCVGSFEEEQQHFDNFMDIVKDHIQEWWD